MIIENKSVLNDEVFLPYWITDLIIGTSVAVIVW
jgi:hypothetical protein